MCAGYAASAERNVKSSQRNGLGLRRKGMDVITERAPRTGVVVVDGFGEYVAEHGAALYRLAFVLAGNEFDAHDVVQEALSRAVTRWDRIQRADDVDAYLRRMVINANNSWWRRTWHRERPRAGLFDGPDRTHDPLGGLVDQRGMWHACAALSRDQRVAVVLRYYEGLSYAEIAEVVGCAEATARSRVFRGLAQLRAALGEEQS
jgi:RNA polymerase sigma-70 factor (sigma-E family)